MGVDFDRLDFVFDFYGLQSPNSAAEFINPLLKGSCSQDLILQDSNCAAYGEAVDGERVCPADQDLTCSQPASQSVMQQVSCILV